jgi:hypothetical protein
LFVIHGSLVDLHVDAVLVPCDQFGDVRGHWGRFRLSDDEAAQLSAELDDGRVSRPRTLGGQVYRYVDTGATPETADGDWLAERVGEGLRAIARDLKTSGATSGRLTRRPTPLVAIPLFGTGDGGFRDLRGEALFAALEQARSVVQTADIDVVIVCWKRADYAALQRQRPGHYWEWTDVEHLPEVAYELAEEISRQRLVLFFGAGVSKAAGLNDFASLVRDLERSFGMYPPEDVPLPTRVQRIAARCSPEELKTRVRKRLESDRYSMAHGLLASLRVRESITTNFDTLYELAAERPYAARFDGGPSELDVLPWQRTSDGKPWLMKAHGDVTSDGPLVFSADEYAAFRDVHGPIASVIQAMFALSREVLFVGYSLTDENVNQLMDEAARYHVDRGVEHSRLGTVLDLDSSGVSHDNHRLNVGLRLGDEDIAHSARRLEIFLDYLGWLASKDEAPWLLDSRYEALLTNEQDREAASDLRDVALPASDIWAPLRRQFRDFGRPN